MNTAIEDSEEYMLNGKKYFNILREQRKQHCNYININTLLKNLKGEEHIALVESETMSEETMEAYPLMKSLNDEIMRIYNNFCNQVKDMQNEIGLVIQKPILKQNLDDKNNEIIKEKINARKTIYDDKTREKYYVYSYYIRFTLLVLMISGLIYAFFKGKINLKTMLIFIGFFILFFSPWRTIISIAFTKYDDFIYWKNNPVKRI